MNKSLAYYLIFNAVYTTAFVIFICGNGEPMIAWWITLLAAAIPSVITACVTMYVSRKSALNRNTEEVQKIARQLGLSDEQTMSHKLSGQYQKIVDMIGKQSDDKTLTGQHKDLYEALSKEITITEQRYAEEEQRICRFTSEQHEIAKTIAEFQLFMESWKRLTSDYNDMKERLDHLEEENQELRQKLENRHNADIPHSRI